MSCVDENVLIEERIDRILTQYRESPKLLFLIRNFLGQIAKVHTAICDMPSYFNLRTAVGDQLTLIGKRMGFPRCHCVCTSQPVFGFLCGDEQIGGQQILGFCEGVTWAACEDTSIADVCITVDDLYRRLLIARSYQMQSKYSHANLTAAMQEIFGETATILDAGHGRVVLAPFRELTDAEIAILQLVPRVLPIAPGIRTRWHFGLRTVFGFGDGWGGFCEPYLDRPMISVGAGMVLANENDDFIVASDLTQGADWMCEIDLHPYDCA